MSEFEVVEKDFGFVIELEERVTMLKMPSVMGKNYSALMEHIVEKHGIAIDAPYCRYVDINWDKQINSSGLKNFFELFTKKWHFYCGIVTEKKAPDYHMMKSKNIPLRKYVKAIHHGPYKNIGKVYSQMYKWLKAEGLDVLPESIEFYTNEPGKVSKEELETILYIPLKPSMG